MSEWQPIETAPRDGTKVILYIRSLGINMGSYDVYETRRNGKVGYHSEGWRADISFVGDIKPLYWMPLPEPPAEV